MAEIPALTSPKLVVVRAEAISAAILHLHDYIYCLTGNRMNYARMTANSVKLELEKALEEK